MKHHPFPSAYATFYPAGYGKNVNFKSRWSFDTSTSIVTNIMAILTNTIKKLGAGLAGLANKIPVRSALRKGTKTAAVLGSVMLAGKLGQILVKKVSKKVDDSVGESKKDALSEIKTTINRELEKFIFECVFRWLIYIMLIMLAYIMARAFNLRKDVLVAFVILGIYTFYVLKFCRVCRWYISFCRTNGMMYNPVKIIRAYLHKAILDTVQRTRAGLSLPERLAMNFFGPASDKIASDLTERSLQSSELKREALARVGMWISGWIIYALVYEKLFLFVTGIDFQAIWEPIVWPFFMVLKILSTR